MSDMITLVPAYGRDYTSASYVYQAWKAGKDFRIADVSSQYNGKMCSIRDFPDTTARIRYNKKQDVTLIGPGE